ncbi:MAG: hypothetical protein ACI9OJ_002374 [Myxococcota bacterium]|jgi:hypothetical protein
MRMRDLFIGGLVVAILAGPSVSVAAEAGCEDDVAVDRFQYYRQLSLDLRQRVPTETELTALIDRGDLSEVDIRAMLADPDFDQFIRRYHTDLFWPAIDIGEIVEAAFAFLLPASFYGDDGDPMRLFALYPALYNRGGLVPCADEPAEFDDAGDPIFKPWPDGTMREGYVMVEPYWAPGTEVKVCALEARLHPTTPSGLNCDTAEGMNTGYCGCGPDLRNCVSVESSQRIVDSLREQLNRQFINPIQSGASYFEALTANTEMLNGPLVHYYRYLAHLAVDPIIQIPPVPTAWLDDVPFTDPTWKSYARSPEHSGILTSLSYLLRFPTGRSRANQFYSTMLCQPFVAAADLVLPSPNDECSDDPNLRTRCGCSACHTVLEPASGYWARFSESGSMYLNPLGFPERREDCAVCKSTPGMVCDFLCDRFYLTEAGHPDEEPWVGTLISHVFRDDDELTNVNGGPKSLVEEKLAQGSMPQCVVRRLYSRFHNQEMTATERKTLLPELVERFEKSDYDFKDLILAIVSLPTYRRMLR